MNNQRYRNIYLDGCSHFCTASIVDYLPLLVDDQMRKIIAKTWQEYRKRYEVRLEGYVIMPEHVHLVIRGKGESVKRFMQYGLSRSSIWSIYIKILSVEDWLSIREIGNGRVMLTIREEKALKRLIYPKATGTRLQ